MIRLAWRQFRVPALVAGAGLVVVGIVVALTGPHLHHVYDTAIRGCTTPEACADGEAALATVESTYRQWFSLLLFAIPVLVGFFWGAPLIPREIETDTHRLVWTQSVTRRRWLLGHLVVGVGAAAVVAGLVSATLGWWFGPISRRRVRLDTASPRDRISRSAWEARRA